jgi:hypothetical protein
MFGKCTHKYYVEIIGFIIIINAQEPDCSRNARIFCGYRVVS